MTKFFTIILLFISTNLSAQDQLAKDLLNNLSTNTKSFKNIKVSFLSTMENKTHKINEKQKGTLELQEDKFRLIMTEQTIISDGEIQWIYLADMNEVQIMEYDSEDDIMSPNKIFTIYERGYKYNYVGTNNEKGKLLQIIDLFPEESGPFVKVTLAIDADKNQLHQITMKDKNGGTYTYLITKFESNLILLPFNFNTSDFPGVEVIDLR
jgi:outer membrane lipoprotein carrier protein